VVGPAQAGANMSYVHRAADMEYNQGANMSFAKEQCIKRRYQVEPEKSHIGWQCEFSDCY
jgi:hypothetical protein